MEPSKRFSSCYRCAEWCFLFHFITLLTIKQWIKTLLSPFKRITWWNKNNVTLCHIDQELINLRIEPAVTHFLVVSSLYQLSLSQQVRLGSLVLESKAIKGESQAPNVMYTPHSYFSYSWVTLSLSIKKQSRVDIPQHFIPSLNFLLRSGQNAQCQDIHQAPPIMEIPNEYDSKANSFVGV